MGNRTPYPELLAHYRALEPTVSHVYVFPRIGNAARYNPYLRNLYRPLAGRIKVCSPFPLLPFFILKRLHGERNIVHYHWLHFADIPGLLVLLWKLGVLAVYRLCGGKIVWTIHNRTPHEGRYRTANMVLRRFMACFVNRLHVHCEETLGDVARQYTVPRSKFFVVPHPRYTVALRERNEARRELKQTLFPALAEDGPLFLMYGHVAEYKGIAQMLPLFRDSRAQLVIAGSVKRGEERYGRLLVRLARDMPNVFPHLRFASARLESLLFGAADCVLFNFHDMLSSGSVHLALSYRRPVIVPRTGDSAWLRGGEIFHFDTLDECRAHIEAVVVRVGAV